MATTRSALIIAALCATAGSAAAFSPAYTSPTLSSPSSMDPRIHRSMPRARTVAAAAIRMGGAPSKHTLSVAKAAVKASGGNSVKAAIVTAATSLTGVAAGLPAALAISLVASSVGFVSAVYFVGYGYALSMTALSAIALKQFATNTSKLAVLHTGLVLAWGVRIFAFLLYREFFAWTQLRSRNKETNKKFKPAAKISTWFFVSVFYALLFSPALFHLQGLTTLPALAKTGLGVAATGLAIESISDASKTSQKRTNPEDFAAKGLFSVVRHPNYLGEVIFWLGSYMTGVGSFSTPLQWTTASLGLAGIIAIMAQATESLEKKQTLRYQTKAGYKEYVASTPKLLPFTKGDDLADLVKAAQAAVAKKKGAESKEETPDAVPLKPSSTASSPAPATKTEPPPVAAPPVAKAAESTPAPKDSPPAGAKAAEPPVVPLRPNSKGTQQLKDWKGTQYTQSKKPWDV